MPELPEVETVRRGLEAVLEGALIVRVETRRGDLRRPFPERFAERLAGRTVRALRRRAKYLLFDLDDGTLLAAHLGMSGRMLVEPAGRTANTPPGPHEHVVFHLACGTRVCFSDPRRFGLMDLLEPGEEAAHPMFVHLGPEPLADAFDGVALARLLAGRRTPIKAALLDQRVVAGLGNIYACEALFAARLSPRRLAMTVQGGRAERLARAIRDVLTEAIAAGGSSLRDHVAPSGELGYFQHSFKVYGREGEPCPACRCPGGIRRLVQAGRSSFYCALHQR